LEGLDTPPLGASLGEHLFNVGLRSRDLLPAGQAAMKKFARLLLALWRTNEPAMTSASS
jgi:hypothetical protein